jgi:MFS family permease
MSAPARARGLGPDFNRLWFGNTVSVLGSEVSELALPLTALLVLEATPGEVGLLNASRFLPYLLVSPLAGVWVDRHRRRPTLVASDLARALALFSIPAAFVLDLLVMEQVLLVAFVVGGFTVLQATAATSYLPSLLGREQLTRGNSRLTASANAAEIGGQGLAGFLVELVTAPVAVLLDGLSYLASAAAVGRIRHPEQASEVQASRNVARELAAGLRVIATRPILRALVAEGATFNFFRLMFTTAFTVYAVQTLELRPAVLGVLVSMGSVGALLGAATAPAAQRRLGLGPALVGALVVGDLGPVAVLAARDDSSLSIALIAVSYLAFGFGVGVALVQTVSIRQAVTPTALLGRVSGAYQLLALGPMPLGGLLGGVLAERIGELPTITVSVAGSALAVLWILLSPVARLREVPASEP